MFAFFKAMALFPDVQARAQAEIDAVVGTDRLPHMGDRTRLPYIDAMVHETIRWQPVTPLGAFHYLINLTCRRICITGRFSSYPHGRRHSRWVFYSERNDGSGKHMVHQCICGYGI